MGQRLVSDKIGALSYSVGNISLAANSILTIGGQQYKNSSVLNLTVPTLASNTLYMVYVVLSGGVMTLVQDTTVNSVGPSGYSAWKLVGAYLSNRAASFGVFLNVEKPFEFSNLQDTWVNSWANATTSVSISCSDGVLQVDAGTLLTGAGATGLTITIPSIFSLFIIPVLGEAAVGGAVIRDAGVGIYDGSVQGETTSTLRIVTKNASATYTTLNDLTATIPFTWAATDFIKWNAKWTLATWSSTLLKDL